MYYKVIANNLKSYISTLECSHRLMEVQYQEGEWVRPLIPHSQLFVFDQVCRARDFVGGNSALQIWECEIQNPQHAYIGDCYDWYTIKKMWARRGRKKKFTHMAEHYLTPIGSVGCSAVKLLKRVQ